MSRFNLSEWALRNRPLVLYFAILLAILGAVSYSQLGQSEDPPFTFRAMVVITKWPGANAEQISSQITERIETKLQEIANLEFVRSQSKPGESQVIILAAETVSSKDIDGIWYQVRKKVGDIQQTFPQEVQGPFFNDEFGDTFGNIYALTGDGFDDAALKDYAKRVQLQLLRLKDVAKVELIGLQDERIYLELDNAKLATLGVPLASLIDALNAQNAMSASGYFETDSDRIYLRPSGALQNVEEIRALPIYADGKSFRLDELATVKRGFAEPAQPRMRYRGENAIGLAVSMTAGGDILRLGDSLNAQTALIETELPLGMELHRVADQPRAVKSSIREFVRALAEAVAIVLLVSFFSLGFRTGMVVALSIPLVLAMTFAAMHFFAIDLHKISLGALILALGLLVDDAIIAVEMMAIKLEQGFDRIKAAAFAYTSTGFPMLTGTLVTAAGFLPIATATSSTGEYTRSIFQVVVIALLISWVAAVVFIPYLGYRLLPDGHGAKSAGNGDHADPYASAFYQKFRRWVEWSVRQRRAVILGTIAIFVLSVAGFGLVQQQFFPSSTRLELMVDLKLAQGSSLSATAAQARKLEAILKDIDGIESFASYEGTGSPRFYLPLDQQLPEPSFAQFVLLTKNIKLREQVRAQLIDLFEHDFPEVRVRVLRLENGPPVGYPIQFRVSGEDLATVRNLARQVTDIMRQLPQLSNVHMDWDEPSKVVNLTIDQNRARALGVSSKDLSTFLQGSLIGNRIGQFREREELIDIVLRGPDHERSQLAMLQNLMVPTAHGKAIPLAQIARFEYGLEKGLIWRRDGLPTVTVRADIYGDIQPPTVTAEIEQQLAQVREQLPPGYLLATGGTVEDSAKGQSSVSAGVPLFILTVTTILMIQLRSFSRTLLVWLTAPLGLIGVTLFLLIFQQPFGFVAMLGTIALSGMIMRNSVILVDQIEQDIHAGSLPWQAVIDATVRRARPIVLTAAAAVFAMIPLSRSVFFGPMAVAIMGGLTVATALTLFFLPALYAAWFRLKEPQTAH